MPSLKEVKTRISSVTSTQQITKAMKMVAAAKLRKSQERIWQMRPFAERMHGILQNLSSAQVDSDNWYSKVRTEEKILLVAISSDRGLCGSFNSNIIKSVLRSIQEKYASQYAKGNVTILGIGKRAVDYFTKRNYKVNADYANIFHAISFEKVSEASHYMMEAFRKGEYDRIDLVYNQFKNVATQILVEEQFLPVKMDPEKKHEAAGKKHEGEKAGAKEEIDYIFQPNQEEILTGLVPKSLHVQLYKAVLDSNASENGARMTAMDKASENAGELLKDLRLTYNRTRQAAITKEILEIVAGAEALKTS